MRAGGTRLWDSGEVAAVKRDIFVYVETFEGFPSHRGNYSLGLELYEYLSPTGIGIEM